MMTKDASIRELHCNFGQVKSRLYKRIYNLRISHAVLGIIIHANTAEGCFRQLNRHPD